MDSFTQNRVTERYSDLDRSLNSIYQKLMKPQSQKEQPEEEMPQEQEYSNGVVEEQDMDQDDPPVEEQKIDLNESQNESQNNLNHSSISAKSINDSGLNVEDRLHMMNTVYKQRREEKLKAAADAKNKTYATKPKINRKSQKMLESKNARSGKIEDRLMEYGKKKNMKASEAQNLNDSVRGSASGAKTSKSKNSEVVSRLMDYGKLYKQKQQEREEEIKKTQTFKPNLDKSSTFVSTSKVKHHFTSSKTHKSASDNQNFLKYTQSNMESSDNNSPMRNSSGYDNYIESHLYDGSPIKEPTMKMQKIQDEYDKNHPFHPNIDSLSKTMVEKKSQMVASEEEVHMRLYNLFKQKKDKEGENYEFKPNINKNSEEIIRLMREGNDYDKQDRWKSLYNYGVMKQKTRKEIEEQIK
jgi:hypothetical protein